jgi:manganese/zinc/iron transport system substrate-binding protein
MTRRLLLAIALLGVAALAASGCGESAAGGSPPRVEDRQIRVVTTTNFITDLARQLGGPRARVTGLMGPGVDPHLYKASAGDVSTLRRADFILYGGLELEGKMSDLFDELSDRRFTLAVTRDIPRTELLGEPNARGRYDPHVWFDVRMWKRAAVTVAAAFKRIDPAHAADYDRRLGAYAGRLDALDAYVRRRMSEVPPRSRVLVTSHDAFRYFGRRYDVDVVAIQGISTVTEATTADIERVAAVIAARRVKAVFIESSVPRQTINAVLAAARRRGQPARVGGQLFSDAAGRDGTPEGTYEGMVRHNADRIAEALR